ncbi:MAG: hypothetical protein JKY85_03335 [Porticoccus sp.]|nr:hypothetical protein [Porticoccus sp.]
MGFIVGFGAVTWVAGEVVVSLLLEGLFASGVFSLDVSSEGSSGGDI